MKRVSTLGVQEADGSDSGVESMLIRAGTTTKTRTIGVIAAPLTLTSHYYKKLRHRWTSGLTVIEADSYGWRTLTDKGLPRNVDVEIAINEMIRWQADIILIADPSYSPLRSTIRSMVGPSVHVLDSRDYM